jgi:hypothetical protein
MASELEGFDECIDKLKDLADEKKARRIFIRALRAGAAVVVQVMKTMVPEDTGATLRALQMVPPKRQKKGFVQMLAGLDKRFFIGDFFYAGFVNYGWRWKSKGRRLVKTTDAAGDKIREVVTSINSNGKKIPGEHWAENAFEEAKARAMDEITKSLAADIEKLGGK